MRLVINESIVLRNWESKDAKRLVMLANNEKIAKYMMDRFPYPYTENDATHWINNCIEEEKNVLLAIEYNGDFIGGIGAHFKNDIHRYNAELGYWIGEPYWGKGIISKAIHFFTNYIFSTYKVNRIYADVFATNPASGKVLEKNGFKKEASLEKAIFKNGFFIDILIYSKLKN